MMINALHTITSRYRILFVKSRIPIQYTSEIFTFDITMNVVIFVILCFDKNTFVSLEIFKCDSNILH